MSKFRGTGWIVAAVLGAATLVWFLSFGPGDDVGSTHGRAEVVELARPETVVATGASADADAPVATGTRVRTNGLVGKSAREVFVATAVSVGDRFAALAELAASGDPDAEHFALQIANECRAMSLVLVDQPSLGQSTATPYQMQISARIKAECADVLASAAYPRFEHLLDTRGRDYLDAPMRNTIRQQFADVGPDAALTAATSAIAQRPDEATVAMVSEVLRELEIGSTHLRAFSQGSGAVRADYLNQNMAAALQLLACSYGRPCGPDSPIVRGLCLATGACVPGADLAAIYRAQLFNGQQMADVLALLAYLQSIRPDGEWRPPPGG